MKIQPDQHVVIWSEYNNENSKCSLIAKTDNEGTCVGLYQTTTTENKVKQEIIVLTDIELERLIKAIKE